MRNERFQIAEFCSGFQKKCFFAGPAHHQMNFDIGFRGQLLEKPDRVNRAASASYTDNEFQLKTPDGIIVFRLRNDHSRNILIRRKPGAILRITKT